MRKYHASVEQTQNATTSCYFCLEKETINSHSTNNQSLLRASESDMRSVEESKDWLHTIILARKATETNLKSLFPHANRSNWMDFSLVIKASYHFRCQSRKCRNLEKWDRLCWLASLVGRGVFNSEKHASQVTNMQWRLRAWQYKEV